jgi:hypothetical protein
MASAIWPEEWHVARRAVTLRRNWEGIVNGSARLFVAFFVPAAVVFVGLYLWIGELPPNKIRLATGQPGGAYEAAGQQIKTILARSSVTVELVPTHGSDDNLKRLTETGTDAIDAAILQSGLPNAAATPGIANLGAIFLEPIWIFARRLPPGIDIRRLIGKRVAAGNHASPTHALADLLLAENNLGPKDVTLVPFGEVDAAWIVGGVKSHWVQTLLASPELELVSFDRAAAYARNHSFLVDVTLAQGAIDLGRNMPGHDLKLIGPTAQIIVRTGLHPALQSLLLDAMREAFSRGDAVTPPGMYPNKDLIDIPLSGEARRYYTSGPSFFRRVLPYWAANFAERAVIFLIPLFALLFPLAQAVPPIYNWRVKNRIGVWYRQLRLLETQGIGARTDTEREEVREKLEAMVHELGRTRIPLNSADDVYRLRAHIRFVLDFIMRETQDPKQSTAG